MVDLRSSQIVQIPRVQEQDSSGRYLRQPWHSAISFLLKPPFFPNKPVQILDSLDQLQQSWQHQPRQNHRGGELLYGTTFWTYWIKLGNLMTFQGLTDFVTMANFSFSLNGDFSMFGQADAKTAPVRMRLCCVEELNSFLHHLSGNRPVRTMVCEHWEIIHTY